MSKVIKKLTLKERMSLRLHKKPLGTEFYVDINKISVPKYMIESRPSPEKQRQYFDRFQKYGVIDKPIIVKRNNSITSKTYPYILKDSYIRHLIIRNFVGKYGSYQIPCKFKE